MPKWNWFTGPPKRGPKTKFDWNSIDWTERDIDIARRLGCSSELVRLKRRALGFAPSMWHHLPKPTIEFTRWLKEHRRKARHMSITEVMEASQTDLSRDAVRAALRRSGLMEGAVRGPQLEKGRRDTPGKQSAESVANKSVKGSRS